MTTAIEVGHRIGRAIARDVLAEDMPREWTGLDAQDADEATAAGLVPDTEEWAAMVEAAEAAYLAVINPEAPPPRGRSFMCRWCHESTDRLFCPNCGHMAGVARILCTCDRCLTGRG
jgi:hypothetical protein